MHLQPGDWVKFIQNIILNIISVHTCCMYMLFSDATLLNWFMWERLLSTSNRDLHRLNLSSNVKLVLAHVVACIKYYTWCLAPIWQIKIYISRTPTLTSKDQDLYLDHTFRQSQTVMFEVLTYIVSTTVALTFCFRPSVHDSVSGTLLQTRLRQGVGKSSLIQMICSRPSSPHIMLDPT